MNKLTLGESIRDIAHGLSSDIRTWNRNRKIKKVTKNTVKTIAEVTTAVGGVAIAIKGLQDVISSIPKKKT